MCKMKLSYSSIPKHGLLHCISLGMDKWFYLTLTGDGLICAGIAEEFGWLFQMALKYVLKGQICKKSSVQVVELLNYTEDSIWKIQLRLIKLRNLESFYMDIECFTSIIFEFFSISHH